jgi:uncharacterized protein with HEPN domain
MKEERLYLQHILDSYHRIQEYTRSGKEEFLKSTLIQDAVIKVLSNLTESANHLHQSTKEQYPNVPWAMIKAFRNVLVHDYLGELEHEEVWYIITNDLPELIQSVKTILRDKT